MKITDFFTEEQQKKIAAAIAEAEKNTSGEIRLHVEKKCNGDPVERAGKIFHHLKMDATSLHNGILFYLAIESHDFAVVGDKGIHEKVHQEFWDQVRDKTIGHFKKKEFTEGLVEAILECGRQLKNYFPYHPEDKNELRDEISYGDLK